jgi:GTP-binding protein YchF
LKVLAEIGKSQRILPATVDFVDIAGLVKGASQGEGLGNKFLTNIRETDAILQVVRCFDDQDVVHVDGSINPVRDIEIIEAELIIADFQMMENRLGRVQKAARTDKALAAALPVFEALLKHLGEGNMAYKFPDRTSEHAKRIFKESLFLTNKKVIYCCNVDEDGLGEDNDYVSAVKAYAAERDSDVVKICAKMEEDLNGMSDEERVEFLKEYGVKESGLDQIVHTGYHTLGLISYLTQGPKETRAWTIHVGDTAPKAAGVIHSDFERGFIRAQVIAYNDFVKYGGEVACREKGLLRTEGKEYIVKDGDVIEFLFNV